MKMRVASLMATTAGIALFAANPALAQSQPLPPSEPVAQDRPAASATQLDEIVVTANRREQSLQEVPIAVTALTGESLERTGVSQTSQLAQVTPGLVLGRNTAQFQPTIRGIGSRAATAGDESNVAIYIDGIYQPEIFAGAFDFLQVERLEVLRGPQGTLFGRNSTGGLINVITPDPSFNLSGALSARYGRFNERSIKGYVTGPLTDRLAFSLAALAYEDDGYVRDLVSGGRTGDKTTYAMRGKLLFDLTDTTRAVLTINAAQQYDSAPVAPTPINGNTRGQASTPLADQPWETALSFDPYSNVRQQGVSLRVTSEFDAVDLEVTASHQANRLDQLSDSDASVADISSFENHTRSAATTAEVRLSAKPQAAFQWTAGVFAFENTARYTPSRVRGANGVISSENFGRNETRSLAAFAEGAYPLTDRFTLTAGTRYTEEERHFTTRFVTPSAVQTVDAETSFQEWTPRVSLQYELTEDANAYVSYSRGFKSGVFNTGGANPLPVEPEYVDAYEVGLKSDPLTWLRLNLSAFHYDYDNIQVSVRNPAGVSTLQNAATAEMQGMEAELTAVLMDDLDLRIAASYLDATYTDFPNALITTPLPGGGNSQTPADVTGNRALRSPEFTLNIGLDYSRIFSTGTLSLSGNAYWSDEYFWDFENRLKQDAYVQVNARVNWDFPGDRLRISLYGENLTDAEVASNVVSATIAEYATWQRPRSYGVEARWSF
nr:TonB-dependent receptor [uncultured Brevundimonas sp.]